MFGTARSDPISVDGLSFRFVSPDVRLVVRATRFCFGLTVNIWAVTLKKPTGSDPVQSHLIGA